MANAWYRSHQFKCYLDDYIGQQILNGSGWDNELESILDRLVKTGHPGWHAIEIGANIGASLVPLTSKYKDLTFHCVEPVPEFYALLEANVASFGATNVRLYNCAVADADGVAVELFTQVGTAGALPQYDTRIPVGRCRVHAKTVDSLFRGLDVGFLKIDVDGFEYSVLRGAANLLREQQPPCFIEFCPELMRRTGRAPSEVAEFFRSSGYESITIYHNGTQLKMTRSFAELLEAAENVYYVDVLFESDRSLQS